MATELLVDAPEVPGCSVLSMMVFVDVEVEVLGALSAAVVPRGGVFLPKLLMVMVLSFLVLGLGLVPFALGGRFLLVGNGRENLGLHLLLHLFRRLLLDVFKPERVRFVEGLASVGVDEGLHRFQPENLNQNAHLKFQKLAFRTVLSHL